MEVIGRGHAKEILDLKLRTTKSELVAVLGRRRIGKTYLIREYLREQTVFRYTGLYRGDLVEHMERFAKTMTEAMNLSSPLQPPVSWFEAFDMLRDYIDSLKGKKKKVVFLDEFPWMASNRSRFLTAFTDFWNSYAADRSDLVVIICGSSASWMINKVLKNKGGLHNRVTERIFLEPFTLGETKQFLKSKQIVLQDFDIVKLYMAMGGVPYYLDQLQKGESVVQTIDRICFAKGAVLRLEYDELMASLFDNSAKHQSIIEALNAHPKGLLRDELLAKTGLNSGGGTSGILEELETSGFITSYVPYGKRLKDKIYKLKDQYLVFYHKFIRPTKTSSKGLWEKLFTSQSYQSWAGLAFENICIDHIDNIKKALKIDGIQTSHGAWHSRANSDLPGAQIDLLIDRADNVFNVCEMKFSSTPYIITADYEQKLRNKIAVFNTAVKHKKAVFPTMVTTFGLLENKYSEGLIQQQVVVKDLFG